MSVASSSSMCFIVSAWNSDSTAGGFHLPALETLFVDCAEIPSMSASRTSRRCRIFISNKVGMATRGHAYRKEELLSKIDRVKDGVKGVSIGSG